jgi:cytoskeletal protein CcmA (bactofilin family)
MALKDFMNRPEAARVEPPAATAAAAAPRPAPSAQSPLHTTYLGASISVTGELRCGESLRIDGKVKGEIHGDQLITIGEKGSVHATIQGDTVVIAGEVQGDITARRKITLESTARVIGDLSTPGIVIQEGARLEGRIVIGGSPPPEVTQPTSQPTAQSTAPRSRPGEKANGGDTAGRSSVIASGA